MQRASRIILNIGALPDFKLVNGSRCPPHYQPLTTSWQACRDAAISLGYTGDPVAHVDYVPASPWGTYRPQGCFRGTLSTGDHRFHFNTGVGGSSEETDMILCTRNSGND